MKELRRNMRLVGAAVVIAFIMLAGWFSFTVFEQGAIWASSSRNTRLRATSAQRGDIVDRNGNVLATTKDGERAYISNAFARRALATTVGDDRGMSGTGVESFHSAQLLDISDSLLERLSALLNGKSRRGNTVELTIDAPMTVELAQAFPSGYRGAVCVLNWKTGEVLAMVSMPNYDPLDVSSAEDTAFMNRCLQGLYTPGSVFKIVTLASALENDPDLAGQYFSCAGTWEYEGGSIVCLGREAHGTVSLERAFAKSCNVTFGKLAYQLGFGRLGATAARMGFGQSLRLSDFTLSTSRFPSGSNNMSDLVWAGIGQSTVLVTPMHMAMIAASVANGGTMIEPWTVRRVVSNTGLVVRMGGPNGSVNVMRGETAASVAQCMRTAVTSGTATRANIEGVTVCGKTGSAETSDDKTVETNAWFVGFIRESAHPYAVAVVIEQGGAGSRMATEVGRKALELAMERE